ncbi:MAG: ABC transporter permease subunit, partial [Halobacteria archaeon]|nr:ABC transporter permease subunit [Halobacteria archaeon]
MSARNWEEKSRAIRRWLDDSRTLRVVAGAVALVALFPLVWLLIRSLSIGHERAANLLLRSGTLRVIGNSVALTVATTVLSVSLGVPLAYLTERTDLPMSRLWSVVVSLPLVIPSYIGAFAYVYTFGPGGSFQSLLESFGVSSLPSIYGFPGTVFIITLYTYPYVYITARAALRSFDTTLVDAARSLRCSRLEAFKRVTVPQIKPAVAAGSLLVALYALSDFGTPMIMHFDAFTREIYVEFGAANRDSAALLSVVLVVLTVLILSVESWFRSDRTLYSQGRSRSKKLSLGRWRWVATLLPALVGLLALAVPLGVMVEWFLRDPPGYTSSLAFEWGYALNSVYVSVAAALVAGVAGVPVAYVSAKRDTRLS